jgi:hypothetical protein
MATIEELVAKILKEILEYQRINNIVNKCVTNTQMLYNMMSDFGIKNIKVEAIIAIRPPDLELPQIKICCGHLVIMVDDVLIEPSYDIYSMTNNYVRNVKDLVDYLKDYYKPDELKEKLQFAIYNYLHFKKIADNINNRIEYDGGEYYEKLRDHLADKLTDYLGVRTVIMA